MNRGMTVGIPVTIGGGAGLIFTVFLLLNLESWNFVQTTEWRLLIGLVASAALLIGGIRALYYGLLERKLSSVSKNS